MVEVNCPKCGDAIEVDERRRSVKGKFRLTCSECGKRFAIQLAKPEPQAPSDSTVVSAPTAEDDSGPDKAPNIATPSAEHRARSRWTRRGEAEARTTVYPQGDSPADGDSEPDTDDGESDSDGFEDLADAEVALPGDPDDESTPMDFDDLAEAEVALPGDPDEEESLPPARDAAPAEQAAQDNEEEESVVFQISADDESSVDRDAARASGGKNPAPAGSGDPPREPAAADARSGTTVSPPEPTKAPARAASVSPPKATRAPARARSRKLVVAEPSGSQVLVSNLDSIPGHDLELLGMVTHHFCRRGGGDRVLARKRVRAFGLRYRRGLNELGRQAKALGADTVIGVEAVMESTGPADNPIVWVLLQGTAAKRRPR